MSNLLLEVDEAMRWERIEKFWKSYGNHVLAAIGLIILATAITSAWTGWNEHILMRDTDRLLTLLEAENFPENIKASELHMRAPLRGIALINAAGAYMQSGKSAEALKLYGDTTNDGSIPRDIRQLAILMQVRLLAAGEKPPENLVEMLNPVLKDGKSPWQASALLEAAALTANRQRDFTAARGYLKTILDDERVPPSLHSKALALDRIYAAREKQAAKKTDGES